MLQYAFEYPLTVPQDYALWWSQELHQDWGRAVARAQFTERSAVQQGVVSRHNNSNMAAAKTLNPHPDMNVRVQPPLDSQGSKQQGGSVGARR